MEFMRFEASISTAIDLDFLVYLKDAEFYGYETLKDISKYCVANGRYCLSHSSSKYIRHPD